MRLKQHEVESMLRNYSSRLRRKHGRVEVELCPFCRGGESRDKWTFVVYLDIGNFKCMRGKCNESGPFKSLCERLGETAKDFYEPDNSPTPVRTLRETPKTFTKPTVQLGELSVECLTYLHLRGFSDETIKTCKLYSDSENNIAIPYYTLENACCMVKLRKPRKTTGSEPKAIQANKNGLRVLWRWEKADPTAGPLVITFGEYDCMALVETGICNAVSVPCGDNDLAWIDICWDELERYSEIILWIDADESGDKALPLIADRLGKERIRVVKTRFKDANEMLFKLEQERGAVVARDAIASAVENAVWYWTGDIIRVCDIGDRPRSEDGILSGYKLLDEAIGGFRFGEMTIHTGDSGHGKSTALLSAIGHAIDERETVCVWSAEDDEFAFRNAAHRHFAGQFAIQEKVSSKTGRTYYEIDKDAEAFIKEWESEYHLYYSKKYGITEDNLFDAFDLAYKRHGARVFIVDNLMVLLSAANDRELLRKQASFAARASSFAVERGVHVHVVAHVNKTGDPTQPPTSKNVVSGAKEITNFAHNVIAWWKVPRKVKEGSSELTGVDGVLCLLKNRGYGVEDYFKLCFAERSKRFYHIEFMESVFHQYGWTLLEGAARWREKYANGIYSAEQEAEMLERM